MSNLILEQIDDNYVNLFESGIFIRAVEYSAIVLLDVTSYKLYVNVDRRSNFVYL
ncbi:MAG: hypothetical protein LBC61_01830 [Candidatus Peribacteria bacterium]|jgi:hypothetical protein|nr:hypothetical protein [Candidatus Peribacteria bacterium]